MPKSGNPAPSSDKTKNDEELTVEEIMRNKLAREIENQRKIENKRREAMKKAEELAEESAQTTCENNGGKYDSLTDECIKCKDGQIYSHSLRMCLSEQSKDLIKETEKEGGKRRKKRKTRRRKKSRKSRRRKGKKSRKSRRRRRRRTRKKKGGVGGVEGPKEDNYALKKIGADAFNQKNLGKSYQEF